MHNIESDSEDELPPGWEEKSTEDGNVYFVNSCTNKIQWIHPRTGCKKVIPKDLPFGWMKSEDETGKILYTNKETGDKTYTDPRLAFAKEEKKHVHDFRQRFDASSTAFQILHGVDLSGKYAMITGSNAGIGYETAKSLARHGCNILFANRNMEATREAIKSILRETNASEECLKAVHLDLASLQSVKKCALTVKTMFSEYASLKNTFTQQTLSMTREQYSSMMAYNNSKFFNVVTAKVLSEEWKSKGICVNSLHPGNMVFTNLSNSWWLFRLAFFIVRPFTKSLQQAAATTVYVATDSDLEDVTGLYFNNCFYCQESELARDKDIAHEVFAISLSMIVRRVGNDHIQKYVDKYVSKSK